jgi:hypothetical protein
MNAKEMDVIYDLCESKQKPIVMHVGSSSMVKRLFILSVKKIIAKLEMETPPD